MKKVHIKPSQVKKPDGPFDPLRFDHKGELPKQAWTYRNLKGAIIGYVCRFIGNDGVQHDVPLRLIDGEPRWLGWSGRKGEYRPVYNLDELDRRPDAPLLVCDTEAAADAAVKLFPERIVLSWQGGARFKKAVDWQPVIVHIARNADKDDFNVVLWPTANEPGLSAMKFLRTLLPKAFVVKTAELPGDWSPDMDAPEGIDLEALLEGAQIETPPIKSKRKKKEKDDVIVTPETPLRGEIPIPETMDLPEGVTWKGESGVMYDVSDYGVFMHRNQIYCKRVDTTKNGDVIREYFLPVSNFSIQITHHFEDENIPMRTVRMVNVQKRPKAFDAESSKFTTLGKFKDMVEGHGNYHFTGGLTDYDRLKSLLMDKMGDGRMINVLGFQPDTRMFAFNNALVTPTGVVHEIGPDGSVEVEGVHYYVRSANHIYKNKPGMFQAQKRMVLQPSGPSFDQWVKVLVRAHGEHAQIALVGMLMCLFSDVVFNKHGMVPLRYFYGEAGSGKTQLIQAYQAMLGRPPQPLTVTGKASTEKAKIRKFAQRRNADVMMEEFRNDITTDTEEFVKNLYNRYGYEKGNIESSIGTDYVPVESGVSITSNEIPRNPQILSRAVYIEMLKNSDRTEDEQAAYGEMEKMIQAGYSNISLCFLRHRDAFEEEYSAKYDEALIDMRNDLTLQAPGIMDRMIQNVAVFAAVYKVFQKRVHFPFHYDTFRATLVKTTLRQFERMSSSNECAQWWDCFAAAVKAGDLVHGEDYKIDGDLLSIRYKDCHLQYQRYHYSQYRREGHAANTMITKLEKSPAYKGWTKGTKFGEDNTSAYIFSLAMIGQEFIDSISMNRSRMVRIRKNAQSELARQAETTNGNGGQVANGTGNGHHLEDASKQDDLPF